LNSDDVDYMTAWYIRTHRMQTSVYWKSVAVTISQHLALSVVWDSCSCGDSNHIFHNSVIDIETCVG